MQGYICSLRNRLASSRDGSNCAVRVFEGLLSLLFPVEFPNAECSKLIKPVVEMVTG